MEIIPCGEIESTSSLATQRLTDGCKPPFAVWATSQTAGRGRRGHAWTSPVGNLYITVVLPSSAVLSAELSQGQYGCLPLKAAILVARVIARRAGIRAAIKWPNDLLLGGRKVGGLLLEMSSAGGKPAEIMIGIGLNLNVAPTFSGTYAATSIADFVQAPQDVASWAQDMVRVFALEWDELNLAVVPRAYTEFGLASGTIWREGASGSLWQAQAVESDGALSLTEIGCQDKKPTVRRLSSVDHGLNWIYLGEQTTPLVVADVGNSRIKIAAFKSARDHTAAMRCDIPADAEPQILTAALQDVRRAVSLEKSWPLHILSVNPQAATQLAAMCGEENLKALTITKKPVRRWGSAYDLEALGIDRLAAIEGYLASRAEGHRARGGRYAVIVSTGTATTIDVVEVNGAHLGGLIFPGLKTALRALRHATQLLPLLEPEEQPDVELGHATQTAMQQGVLQMTLGAIESVRAKCAGQNPGSPVDVILTGGQAGLLSRHVESMVMSDLILDGARQLVLGGA